MMHKIVSKSEQMEPFVVRESMLNDGHRCGACHRRRQTDDAQDRQQEWADGTLRSAREYA